MNFLWKDYLLLAGVWKDEATTSSYPEAVYRSAISRAYYAVFHAAFDAAQNLGMQATRSASDHYRLRKFFEGRGRIAAQLSFALRTLYDLRISADYEINEHDLVTSNAQAAAQQALDTAHQALQVIEYLKSRTK